MTDFDGPILNSTYTIHFVLDQVRDSTKNELCSIENLEKFEPKVDVFS
jgi:hypothetical protein